MRQFLKPVQLFGGFAQKMIRYPQPTQIFRDDQQVDGEVKRRGCKWTSSSLANGYLRGSCGFLGPPSGPPGPPGPKRQKRPFSTKKVKVVEKATLKVKDEVKQARRATS